MFKTRDQMQQEATAIRDGQFVASVSKLLDNIESLTPTARKACNDMVNKLTSLFDPCNGSLLVHLPQALSSVVFTYLDVRSHKRLGAACKAIHSTSTLQHTWCLRMRALGLVYGCHLAKTCDWKRAEALLVSITSAAAIASPGELSAAQGILGLLYMEQASWERCRGSVLYDRAFDLWSRAAAAGDVLAQVWSIVADPALYRSIFRRARPRGQPRHVTKQNNKLDRLKLLRVRVADASDDDALALYALHKMDELLHDDSDHEALGTNSCRFLSRSAHLGFAPAINKLNVLGRSLTLHTRIECSFHAAAASATTISSIVVASEPHWALVWTPCV